MNKFFKILFFLILSLQSFYQSNVFAEEKIKIGLLVPISGENKELGEQIVKSTRIALKDINSSKFEIYLKDTNSNPNKTLKSAVEFKEMGIRIVIGPIFYKSLTYLDEIEGITFLSLTNKTLGLPKNVISAGINATSQLNAIKKSLKACKGKFVCILDSDDFFEKNKIKKIVKFFKENRSSEIVFDLPIIFYNSNLLSIYF